MARVRTPILLLALALVLGTVPACDVSTGLLIRGACAVPLASRGAGWTWDRINTLTWGTNSSCCPYNGTNAHCCFIDDNATEVRHKAKFDVIFQVRGSSPAATQSCVVVP